MQSVFPKVLSLAKVFGFPCFITKTAITSWFLNCYLSKNWNIKDKGNNMRVVLYRERMREVRFIQRKWLQVNCCLSWHITVPNCTHLINKNIGEKTILFSLKWLVAWRETLLVDWRIINVLCGVLFGALYHLYCLLFFQIKELHLKLFSTPAEYILAVQFT